LFRYGREPGTVKPIVVIGSVNTDLVVHTAHLPRPGETVLGGGFRSFPGGKGANQAVAIARLEFPVALLGKLGKDPLGDDLLAALVSAGVGCEAVQRGNTPSGVALITIEDSGENSIVVAPGANAEVVPADIERHAELIRSAAMVLLQLEIPLATVEAVCGVLGACGVPLMLDPAPAQGLPDSVLEHVTWLTPNETEATSVLGRAVALASADEAHEVAEELLALGAKNVILKLGSRGSFLATSDGKRAFVPAFTVLARDSTGAGDAYNGALAVALARGAPPKEAARYASAAAAISVSREGAQPSMPTRVEVEEFLGVNREVKDRVESH
jgi:ribokinase